MISIQEQNLRLQYFNKMLKKNDLRITPQKNKIFEEVSFTDLHPDAQDIFEKVQKKFPTISFSTVYKNLKTFVKIGVVTELDLGEGRSRFDANMTHHQHIIYENGKIDDIILQASDIPNLPKQFSNLDLSRVDIHFFVKDKK
ncbi:transcriptional repressor [Candidatus Peregrinibacteria bacterium]|nr:MAG: transcriptional repressor [Candidatus Peregrinibacteria bacterium]